MLGAWFDDLYNRIHISPRNIALGNTFGNQTRTVNVWNAHLTPKVLDTIDGTGTEGMSITTPSTLPITFSVLAEKQFTLNVSLDGPAIINGIFLFGFTSPVIPGVVAWDMSSVTPTPTPELELIVTDPTLSILSTNAGEAVISWTPATPGFVLQETLSLAPTDWTNSPSGSTNPVTVPASLATKFYRVTKP